MLAAQRRLGREITDEELDGGQLETLLEPADFNIAAIVSSHCYLPFYTLISCICAFIFTLKLNFLRDFGKRFLSLQKFVVNRLFLNFSRGPYCALTLYNLRTFRLSFGLLNPSIYVHTHLWFVLISSIM